VAGPTRVPLGGIGLRLRADGPAPVSVDLFATSLVVTGSGGGYQPDAPGVTYAWRI
jgi:hypothetical protein